MVLATSSVEQHHRHARTTALEQLALTHTVVFVGTWSQKPNSWTGEFGRSRCFRFALEVTIDTC